MAVLAASCIKVTAWTKTVLLTDGIVWRLPQYTGYPSLTTIPVFSHQSPDEVVLCRGTLWRAHIWKRRLPSYECDPGPRIVVAGAVSGSVSSALLCFDIMPFPNHREPVVNTNT